MDASAARGGGPDAGGSHDAHGADGGSDVDDDLPDVGLEELLDELTLGADEGDDDEADFPFLAGATIAPTAGPSDAPSAGPSDVAQFEMPNNKNTKYYF